MKIENKAKKDSPEFVEIQGAIVDHKRGLLKQSAFDVILHKDLTLEEIKRIRKENTRRATVNEEKKFMWEDLRKKWNDEDQLKVFKSYITNRYNKDEEKSRELFEFISNTYFSEDQLIQVIKGLHPHFDSYNPDTGGSSLSGMRSRLYSNIRTTANSYHHDNDDNELTIEQIKLYAKPEYNWKQMQIFRKGLSKKYKVDDILFTIREKNNYELMVIIMEWVAKHGQKWISKYMDKGFNKEQVEQILKCKEKGLADNKIDSFAKKHISNFDMYRLNNAYEEGATVGQINFCVKGKFEWSQMSEILDGFKSGLTKKQVLMYAKKDMKSSQMCQIRECFEEDFSEEQIKYLATKVCKEKINIIKDAIKINLTMEQLEILNDEKYNWGQASVIKKAYEYDLSEDKIKLFSNPQLTDYKMELIFKQLERGQRIETVKIYAKPEYSYDDMQRIIDMIKRSYNNLDFIKKILKHFADRDTELRYVLEDTKNRVHHEMIELYVNKDLNIYQIEEIREGIKQGLSKEQILVYNNPKIKYSKMRETREFFVKDNSKLCSRIKRFFKKGKVWKTTTHTI